LRLREASGIPQMQYFELFVTLYGEPMGCCSSTGSPRTLKEARANDSGSFLSVAARAKR
jgi:hypothetical protein